jgi:hypothetical protein
MPKLTDRQRYEAVITNLHKLRAAVNATETAVVSAGPKHYSSESVSRSLKLTDTVDIAFERIWNESVALQMSKQEFENPS